MNPKVSILVPIYKTSTFIEKCAHSLFGQTFSDIEYIFVDDASPDDSIDKLLNVILKFPDRKKNIQIIRHKVNKGAGAAKKKAIESSTGDYITFVDSDDFIELNMIEVLYNRAIEDDADIVVADLLNEYENRTTKYYNTIVADKWINFINLLSQNKISNTLSSKLIRRTLYTLPECCVPSGLNYMEDGYVLIRMFYFAKHIVKIDQNFYHYVHSNENSITKSKIKMHFENVIQFWNSLDDFLKTNNEFEKYKQLIELPKTQTKARLMTDTHSSELRKEFYDMFRDIEMKYIFQLRKGEIIMLLLVRYKLFWLAQLFHNLLVYKNKKKI